MIADDDEERRIWALIQGQHARQLAVHIGIGRHDRFGHGHALFGDALPASAVDVVDGGHEWPAWRRLWDLFPDRFAASAARPLGAASA